jgi:hypothetical protein
MIKKNIIDLAVNDKVTEDTHKKLKKQDKTMDLIVIDNGPIVETFDLGTEILLNYASINPACAECPEIVKTHYTKPDAHYEKCHKCPYND